MNKTRRHSHGHTSLHTVADAEGKVEAVCRPVANAERDVDGGGLDEAT